MPSSPLSPWISGAWTAGRQKGFAAPAYKGVEVREIAVRTREAFFVVCAREEFPWTVLMPKSLNEGWCEASRMAKASFTVESVHRVVRAEDQSPYIMACSRSALKCEYDEPPFSVPASYRDRSRATMKLACS